MKKNIIGIMLGVLILALCFTSIVTDADNPFVKYLSVGEVEKATGLKGVKANHNVFLIFNNIEGNMILRVRFTQSKDFERETKPEKYWAKVTGIGDKAKIGLPQAPCMLIFTKGERMVTVYTFMDNKSGKYFLTAEQLKAISKAIEKNLTKK